MKTTKITVQRIAMAGAASQRYRITKLNGEAEVTITALVRSEDDKAFVAGDEVTHEELKRLCDVTRYDVTTTAPGN